MIKFEAKGEFKETEKFLKNLKEFTKKTKLDDVCRQGVQALKAATPVATGKTANSWNYKITRSETGIKIEFTNSNTTVDGCPVPILLVYGHSTKGGGFVSGRDFVTPAIEPIFKQIAEEALKEVGK